MTCICYVTYLQNIQFIKILPCIYLNVLHLVLLSCQEWQNDHLVVIAKTYVFIHYIVIQNFSVINLCIFSPN